MIIFGLKIQIAEKQNKQLTEVNKQLPKSKQTAEICKQTAVKVYEKRTCVLMRHFCRFSNTLEEQKRSKKMT